MVSLRVLALDDFEAPVDCPEAVPTALKGDTPNLYWYSVPRALDYQEVVWYPARRRACYGGSGNGTQF
ncbi:MAG: hypothetical protein LBD24_00375 [Spirochaetaceae bacterium]|nr:hypothetical protein [Spirochaetaceae bacterium]